MRFIYMLYVRRRFQSREYYLITKRCTTETQLSQVKYNSVYIYTSCIYTSIYLYKLAIANEIVKVIEFFQALIYVCTELTFPDT